MNAQEEYIDQLDLETFTCAKCNGQFKATEGTWPRNRADGTPIYTWHINSDANDDSIIPFHSFYCYDCVD